MYDNVNTLRETLDLFEFTGDVLILTGNKKEEVMVKRTNATHLVFDVLTLRKYIGQAQQLLVEQRVKYINQWNVTVLNYIGEERYNSLKDPRFAELLQVDDNDSSEKALTPTKYNLINRIIGEIGSSTYDRYYKNNKSELNKLKEKWLSSCSYQAVSYIISGRYEGSYELEAQYSRYVPVRISLYIPESYVVVLNAIYDDFLSEEVNTTT